MTAKRLRAVCHCAGPISVLRQYIEQQDRLTRPKFTAFATGPEAAALAVT
jgi:hypothetical protein